MSKLSTSLGRSGNPALTSEVFNKSITSQGEVMTLQGTVNKTTFSLFLLVAAGSFTFSPDYSWLIWPGFIGGFIVAMITIFKKRMGSNYCSDLCNFRRPSFGGHFLYL